MDEKLMKTCSDLSTVFNVPDKSVTEQFEIALMGDHENVVKIFESLYKFLNEDAKNDTNN